MDSIGIGRFTRFTPGCLILAFMLGVPFSARSAEINVNGTCEVNCPGPPSNLSNGESTSGSFNFNYTFGDGDIYNISGAYGASYSTVTGSFLLATPVVTYEGASPSVGFDTITFDVLQGYYDASPGSWAGTYHEAIPLKLDAPAGSTISAQALEDGESVGLVGPYGPGTYFDFGIDISRLRRPRYG